MRATGERERDRERKRERESVREREGGGGTKHVGGYEREGERGEEKRKK